MPADDVPPYTQLLWPTVRAVRTLGGSGSIGELDEAVIAQEGFGEDVQRVLHGAGPKSKLEYRLAWARTYLKMMGLLDNSARGVWSLTEEGRSVAEEQIPALHAAAVATHTKARRDRPSDPSDPSTQDENAAADWRALLLATLMDVPPDAFERLAQRLLREAGFVNTTVTGRSGDGGLDGVGVYRMSLVSFPVFFQCKRYRGSVGSGAVRDFRGAMAGRGDKGLLITTGTFTADARAEATRDGAPPVDLIDGERLCDLLKEYELGLRTTTRVVEDVAVDEEFFADL